MPARGRTLVAPWLALVAAAATAAFLLLRQLGVDGPWALLGLAGGLSATAEYEIMVAGLVGLDPKDGLGAKALDVLNVGHLVIIAAIVFGNVIFFLGRRRARRVA